MLSFLAILWDIGPTLPWGLFLYTPTFSRYIFDVTGRGILEMATGARSMLLAAVLLAGFGDPATSQTAPREYEAFIRAEINKCVAESVRLDKEAGALKHPSAPTQAQRVASCREMILQIHDLYPMPEPEPKKKAR